jgi:hypothetical protein
MTNAIILVLCQSSIEEWHGHLGRESQAGNLYYMFLKARLTEH